MKKRSLFCTVFILLILFLFSSLSLSQTSLSSAPSTGAAASVEGFCCDNGQVISATLVQCRQKEGRYYQTKAEALKTCKPDRVFCCINGKVSEIGLEQCKRNQGTIYTTGGEAKRRCKPEEVYCCLKGKVKTMTPGECRKNHGTAYTTGGEAKRRCKPEEVYCCLKGNVKKMTPGECRKNHGTAYTTGREAKRRCKPEEVYCCLKGNIKKVSLGECKKKKGKSYTSEMEARKNCGWCCAENQIFPATPEGCKRKKGNYFTSKVQADRQCREQPQCCIEGELFTYSRLECEKEKGRYYHFYREGKQQCLAEKKRLSRVRQQSVVTGQVPLRVSESPRSKPDPLIPLDGKVAGGAYELSGPSSGSKESKDVAAGILTVSVDGSTPVSSVIPRNASSVLYTVWGLEASNDEPINVEGLTVVRVGLGDPEDFTELRLYVDGIQHGSKRNVNTTDNSATFSLANLPIPVPAGGKLLVSVVADMDAGVNAENALCMNSSDDITAYGALSGEQVSVTGSFAACGEYMYTSSEVVDDSQPSDYLRPTITDPDYLRPAIPSSSTPVPPPPDPPPPPELFTFTPILLEATAFYDAKENQPNSFRVISAQFDIVTFPDTNQRYIAAALLFNRNIDDATVVENVNLRLLKQNEDTIFWGDASTQNNNVRIGPNFITWLSGAPVINGHYKMHLRGTIKSEGGLFLDCDGDGVGEGGALPAYESQIYQIHEPAIQIIEGDPGGIMNTLEGLLQPADSSD